MGSYKHNMATDSQNVVRVTYKQLEKKVNSIDNREMYTNQITDAAYSDKKSQRCKRPDKPIYKPGALGHLRDTTSPSSYTDSKDSSPARDVQLSSDMSKMCVNSSGPIDTKKVYKKPDLDKFNKKNTYRNSPNREIRNNQTDSKQSKINKFSSEKCANVSNDKTSSDVQQVDQQKDSMGHFHNSTDSKRINNKSRSYEKFYDGNNLKCRGRGGRGGMKKSHSENFNSRKKSADDIIYQKSLDWDYGDLNLGQKSISFVNSDMYADKEIDDLGNVLNTNSQTNSDIHMVKSSSATQISSSVLNEKNYPDYKRSDSKSSDVSNSEILLYQEENPKDSPNFNEIIPRKKESQKYHGRRSNDSTQKESDNDSVLTENTDGNNSVTECEVIKAMSLHLDGSTVDWTDVDELEQKIKSDLKLKK